MRSLARALGVVLLVPAALIATGCNSYLVNEGDPNAPILVQGRVVDASGGGMSGARIEVQVADDRGAQVGDAVRIVYEGQFSAGLDGTFVVRLAPSPELAAHAVEAGGVVSVTLLVFADADPFTFPRELRDGIWLGDVPSFVFGPDGVTTPSGEPGVPSVAPSGG